MTIEVSGAFNIELFGLERQKSPVFRKRYRTFIFLTLVHQLNHLFAPHSLFKRGYERTDDIQRLVDNLGLVEDDEFSKLERVENVIKRYLTEVISSDGRDFYGIYEVVKYQSTRMPGFLVRYVDDYRIVEWNAGRGRPQTTTLTEGEAANQAIISGEEGDEESIQKACLDILSMPRRVNVPSGLKIWKEPTTIQRRMHDSSTMEIRERVREIEQRIADDMYVDEHDLQYLNDHEAYR